MHIIIELHKRALFDIQIHDSETFWYHNNFVKQLDA